VACLLKTPCDAQSLIIFPSEAGSRSRMLELTFGLLSTARSSFKGQRELAPENLALRQQLAILKRNTNRPRLTWIASSGSMSQRQPYPASCLGIENHLRRPGAGLHSKSYCERVIGSIRRECLKHVVVLGERHLLRLLSLPQHGATRPADQRFGSAFRADEVLRTHGIAL